MGFEFVFKLLNFFFGIDLYSFPLPGLFYIDLTRLLRYFSTFLASNSRRAPENGWRLLIKS